MRTVEVLVWACHEQAVAVFRGCQLDCAAIGMGGLFWLGISAAELRAALAVERIPRCDWPDVGEDVRYMGRVVADEHNRRAKREAKR